MSDQPLSTRREFLHRGLALAGAGATVPMLLQRTALAVERPGDAARGRSRRAGGDERILVVVQLAGGNDGLNTVIPVRQDAYYRLRPHLAVPKSKALRLTDDLSLNPAAADLKRLYDDGHLAIVQGVGYPNPNRSHFRSTDIWETASPDNREHKGWIGRYFDHVCTGAEPCPPARAVALTQQTPLALQGDRFAGIAFTNAQSLSWRGSRPREVADALDAQVSADHVRRAARGASRGGYPRGPFGASLELIARMIAAGLPTRVYYASLGGFDTHSGQATRHPQLLTQLAEGLRAFRDDLAHNGDLDRVLVMTFSEFGRRVAENASGGTDHGEAAPMLLVGSKVRAGAHGEHPDLERLHRGDVAFDVDFRRVYAAMLGTWLGADPSKVLGRGFTPLPVVQA